MQHPHRIALVVFLAVLAAAGGAAGEPLFTLTEDGQAFLYRGRPGDTPGSVAAMFGIPAAQLPAFLAANHIADPTRLATGFTYRIPNPVAQRADALEQRNAELTREAGDLRGRVDGLERDLGTAEERTRSAEHQAARAAWLERLWPITLAVIGLLAVAVVAAGWVAATAAARQRRAEAWAKAVARELEEKRAAGLAERQESARRALALENRVRELEAKVGPRIISGGRSS